VLVKAARDALGAEGRRRARQAGWATIVGTGLRAPLVCTQILAQIRTPDSVTEAQPDACQAQVGGLASSLSQQVTVTAAVGQGCPKIS